MRFFEVDDEKVVRELVLGEPAASWNVAVVCWQVSTHRLVARIEFESEDGVTKLTAAYDSRTEEPSFYLAAMRHGQQIIARYMAFGKCLLTLTLTFNKEGVIEVSSSLTPVELASLQKERGCLPMRPVGVF